LGVKFWLIDLEDSTFDAMFAEFKDGHADGHGELITAYGD